MKLWHYVDLEGEQPEQRGPVPESYLKQRFAAGSLSPDTPVWRDGMEDWSTYGEAFPKPSVAKTVKAIGAPSQDLWYYREFDYRNGDQYLGPVEGTELTDRLASGSLPADTLIRRAGSTDWSPICEVFPGSAGIPIGAGEETAPDRKEESDPRPYQSVRGWLWAFGVFIGAILIMAISKGVVQEAGQHVREGTKANQQQEAPIEQTLREVAVAINASLPKMVNADMRLDRVASGPGRQLSYYYTAVNRNSWDVSEREFIIYWATPMRVQARETGVWAPFAEQDVSVVLRYSGRDGGSIGVVSIPPAGLRR